MGRTESATPRMSCACLARPRQPCAAASGSGSSFFARWFDEVVASGLRPMIKVAKMFKRHIEGILKWYETFIDNAMTEGFNAKIQTVKAGARGFRNFENYRVAILFNCGKLDMQPVV